jgi:hypothetical protein
MNFTQLREVMPALLDSGISIEMMSAPGRGKSQFNADTVEIMSERDGEEWGFATLFLATQTPPDLLGYVFKGERTWDDKKVAISEATLPSWMMTSKGKPVWAHKRGILLLDEYGQGEADVKRASAELLLNKQLGPWKLPEGWSVIACSNRASDRSGVTKSFDFVINRRMEINITDDLEAWLNWAATHDVMPLTQAFAKQNPQIVFQDGVPDKQGPWCTPRSLVMADQQLQALAKYNGGRVPDAGPALELVGGLISTGSAAQYFSFVRLQNEMPPYEKIISDPKKAKVPEKPDALMLVAFQLAHNVRADEVNPVLTYVDRMPKEFSVTFATAACKRDVSLVAHPGFYKWAMQNASLMAAIIGGKK